MNGGEGQLVVSEPYAVYSSKTRSNSFPLLYAATGFWQSAPALRRGDGLDNPGVVA
ncbi:hypothetical protein LMG29739_04883 [Paraburkholderia solisilvae]|uniref:Uncharacterized protein n=1 Tax=Paraburkholderia solisilvae TaxID=624376 RepID=A0A6J5EK74_9BURK|nr:hypothetical protein LMG29739_04883 [Paraburkholderia solisilvae]